MAWPRITILGLSPQDFRFRHEKTLKSILLGSVLTFVVLLLLVISYVLMRNDGTYKFSFSDFAKSQTQSPVLDKIKEEKSSIVGFWSKAKEKFDLFHSLMYSKQTKTTDSDLVSPMQLSGDRNSSNELVNFDVDMVYVLHYDPSCHSERSSRNAAEHSRRWALVVAWAKRKGLRIRRMASILHKSVNMEDPPIPILNLPLVYHEYEQWLKKYPQGSAPQGRRPLIVSVSQLVQTVSHIRIWSDAFHSGYKRVMVMEDSVILHDALCQTLSYHINAVTEHSIISGRPWHMIWIQPPRQTYSRLFDKPSLHSLVLDTKSQERESSLGLSSVYVVSKLGVEWLLSHLVYYQMPLDLQLLWYASYRPDFVAYSICNRKQHRKFWGSLFLKPTRCLPNVMALEIGTRRTEEECLKESKADIRLKPRRSANLSSIAVGSESPLLFSQVPHIFRFLDQIYSN